MDLLLVLLLTLLVVPVLLALSRLTLLSQPARLVLLAAIASRVAAQTRTSMESSSLSCVLLAIFALAAQSTPWPVLLAPTVFS